jgi:hypothetical protein
VSPKRGQPAYAPDELTDALDTDHFVIEAWLSDHSSVLNIAARYSHRAIPKSRLIKRFPLEEPGNTELLDAAAVLMRAFMWDHGGWGRYTAERASAVID